MYGYFGVQNRRDSWTHHVYLMGVVFRDQQNVTCPAIPASVTTTHILKMANVVSNT